MSIVRLWKPFTMSSCFPIVGYSCTRLINLSGHQQHLHRHTEMNNQRRTAIPNFVYLQNPWKLFLAKLNIWKLQIFLDPEFKVDDFIRGSKHAAIVMTNSIRDRNYSAIGRFATPVGFQEITRDMSLSRQDSRLKLVQFEVEHLRKAVPMKVAVRPRFGRNYCFIDMLFVGMRNTKDFESAEDILQVQQLLRKFAPELKTSYQVLSVPDRILFAEIIMRFRRDYTAVLQNDKRSDAWLVSFYKIRKFEVMNYNPKS